ncbi:MAG: alpha/beta hydrolase [Acidimicrobiaceae bacterium]|nr:alpha/beta hydrolase [Acidimicrobiaceae bacterium]MBO0748620.1 alpha/beta hydrolase [Acidimicrobiaceae bacterium]
MAAPAVKEAWVEMSHGKTRYFEAGTGPDVLLIHGAGFLSGAHSWLGVLPQLGEHFHARAIDCLGFGPGGHLAQPYSFGYMVDHLREFVDVLGIERTHLVGHSMGGWLAVLLAYESPDRVNRLVDVAGGGTQTRPLANMVEWQPPAPEAIEEGLAGQDPAIVKERLEASTDPAVVTSFRGLMDHMTNPETRVRYNTLRRMPHIKAPTLVLWGEDDKVNDLEAARLSHENIPGSELKVLPGVGHAVPREAPEVFVQTVVEFLEK